MHTHCPCAKVTQKCLCACVIYSAVHTHSQSARNINCTISHLKISDASKFQQPKIESQNSKKNIIRQKLFLRDKIIDRNSDIQLAFLG